MKTYVFKRHLVLGRKALRNLDSVFKSKDVTLLISVCLAKAMVFPVFMYRCENWTISKAKELMLWTVVLEKTLQYPLDSKR